MKTTGRRLSGFAAYLLYVLFHKWRDYWLMWFDSMFKYICLFLILVNRVCVTTQIMVMDWLRNLRLLYWYGVIFILIWSNLNIYLYKIWMKIYFLQKIGQFRRFWIINGILYFNSRRFVDRHCVTDPISIQQVRLCNK